MKNAVTNKIKFHRQQAGMTQSDLADCAGVSRQSIISIEKGQYVPSLPLALKLAQIFKTSTDNLFTLEDEPDDR
ncbi:MAG TPA: helix-turn-helix transcriptional regulator [bacterium]|nr:helix-turn-helix transcriptional regulator [bacterium]